MRALVIQPGGTITVGWEAFGEVGELTELTGILAVVVVTIGGRYGSDEVKLYLCKTNTLGLLVMVMNHYLMLTRNYKHCNYYSSADEGGISTMSGNHSVD